MTTARRTFPSPAVAADAPALRAGVAAADVTPTAFPVSMVGNFGPNIAQMAHDPLRARALVLDDGKTQLALVVVDSMGVDRDVVDEAKRIAYGKGRTCPVRDPSPSSRGPVQRPPRQRAEMSRGAPSTFRRTRYARQESEGVEHGQPVSGRS